MKSTKQLSSLVFIVLLLSILPLYSNVNSRNNRPVLDDSYNPVLASILEDVFTSSGTSVSVIIPAGSITDADGVTNSMAVVEVDNSNGLWQYSLNNGTSWLDFANVTGEHVVFPEQALLLSGQLSGNLRNKIRFIPNPEYPNENSWDLNYNGESTFSYKAWDESQLSAGLTLDTTDPANDGISFVSDSATIEVTAINDDPIFLQNNILIQNSYTYPDTVVEGEVYTFSNAGFTTEDWDIGNNQLIFNISTQNGIINFAEVDTTRFISGNNSNTVTIVSSINFVNSYLSEFTYLADQYFTGFDTLFVRLNDQGKTGLGGGEDIFKTVAVYVAPQNYAPVLNTSVNHTLRTILEDDIYNSGTLISQILTDDSVVDFNDIIAPEGIALCAVDNRNGVWQYSLDDGFSFTNVSNLEGDFVELENEALLLDGDLVGGERNRLRFIPNQNYTGSAELEFRAWDKAEFEPGDIVDAGLNGGFTSISAERDDAKIYISFQNDSPELHWGNQLVPDSLFIITEITSPFSHHFTSEDSIYISDSDIEENILFTTLSVNQGILLFNDPARFISDNGTNSVSIAGDIAMVNSYLTDFRYLGESTAQGLENLSVTLDDLRGRNIVTKHITFQVTNSAPVFESAQQVSALEDSEFSFIIETSDADGNPITITAEDLPEWLTLEDNHDGTAILWGTPLNEQVGIVPINLLAADYYTTSAQILQINVENTNDNPQLVTELPDLSENEDFIIPFTINLGNYFTDEDVDDVLVYEVLNNDLHLHTDITGSVLTISSVLNWFGTTQVTVIADDQVSINTISDTFTVVISPVNDIPLFTTNPVLTAVEDSEYIYDLTLIDVEDNEVEITASLLPEWLNFEVTGDLTARLSGTPLNENVGENRVTISANDGLGISAVQDFVIVVANTNDAPVLLADFMDYEVSEDFEEAIVIDLTNYFYDEDAYDVLQYQVDFEEENINCAILGSILTINSVLNWNGIANIAVNADDGNIEVVRASVADQFQINVLPVNDTPEFTSIPILTAQEDSEYFYSVTTLDVDTNTTLTLSAEILPEWLELNIVGNGLAELEGIPLNENVGINPIKLIISDNQGRVTSEQEFDLEVINTNDAPILDLALLDYDLEEDFQEPIVIELNGHFSDVDALDLLNFQVQNNIEEVTAQIQGSVLTITSVLNWSGVAELVVSASDNLETISDNMMINISPINDVPFVEAAIEDFSFEEDSIDTRIQLEEVFGDADLIYGDELTFSFTGNLNLDVNLSEETGGVVLTPTPNWYGTEELVFIAEDLAGEIVRDSVIVTVENINDAPESTLPELLTIQEDEVVALNFADYLTDIDSNNFTIIPSGNNRIDVTLNDLMVEFRGDENWSGSEVIVFNINDNDNRAVITDEITVMIEPVNDPPYILENLEDFSMFEDLPDSSINLSSIFADVDFEYGDELTYSASATDHFEILIAQETGAVNLIPQPDWFGIEELTFSATDVAGANISDVVIVTVININDAPLGSLPEVVTFDEDEALIMNFSDYIFDSDSDPLTITPSGNSHINIIINDMQVEFIPTPNWNGAEVVHFEISDNEVSSSLEADMQIIVNSINDAPVVAIPIQDFSFDEDTVFSEIDLNLVFTDADLDYGDSLIFSVAGNSNLTIDIHNGLVDITPLADWFGTETIQFMATDLDTEQVIETVEITINNVNDVPVMALPGELILQEDEILSLDFSQYCYDIDSDVLSLSTADDNMINLEITGLMVNIAPEANWSGAETITFFLSDNESRAEVQDIILITVSAVNDAPVIVQEIPDFSIFEDEPDDRIDLQNVFTDYDLDYGDELSLSFSGNSHLTIEIAESGVVNVIPEPEWSGEETIIFTAADMELESISDEVTITVIAVNDAPEISLPSLFSFNEDNSLAKDFSEFVNDVDSDNISLTSTGEANIQVGITGLNVVFSALENWNGSEVITFIVSDNDTRLFSFGTVEIIVEPINDAPFVANPLVDFSFDEDSVNNSINLATVFNDVDTPYGDLLSFSFSGNQNINVDINEVGLVTLTPAAEWSGIELINFTVEDLAGELVEDDVEITVLNVNDAPEITLPVSFTFAEDETLNLDFSSYIFDIDSEELTLGFSDNNEILVVITGNNVTLTASENWSGSETITFSVDDNSLRTVTTDEVLVVVQPVNDLPFVETALVDFEIDEDSVDTSINLNNIFNDYDLAYGDELSYTADASANFTIEISETGVVTLTPTAEWYGEEELVFIATDLLGEDITDNVNVTVNNVDDPPEIDLPDSFEMEEDTVLNISFEALVTDIDSEVVYLSVANNENITIDINELDVTFEPSENWCGLENVTFTVSDSLGRSIATDNVDIVITPLNDSPVVAIEIDEIIFPEDGGDSSIQLNDLFTDPDIPYGDELNFSFVQTENIIVEIDSETGIVELTSTENWNGSEFITLTAEDSEEEAISYEIAVSVTPVNDAPVVVEELSSITILEDESYNDINLTAVFSDPDFANGDTLSFSYVENENLTVQIENGEVSIIPLLNWNGETSLEFIATDSEGLWITEILQIVVEDVNDVPIVVNPLENIILSLDESIQIDLNDVFHDEENELSFEIVAQSSHISAEFTSESTILIQPVEDYTGEFSVTVKAEDGVNGRASTEYTFYINVDPIYNHPETENITSELDFGTVFVSQESEVKSVEIFNMGHANLDVESIEAPTGFMIRKSDENEWLDSIAVFTIIEGDSQILDIIFAPEKQMSYSSTLIIHSNAVINPELEIELRGETKNSTPNAFTPNGDGKNDSFTISLGSNSSDPISLHIINLNGREIRKIKGVASNPISWDGRDSDGKRCKVSPYLYYLKQNGSRVMRGKVYLVK